MAGPFELSLDYGYWNKNLLGLYYIFHLMIIDAFCEMQSHFYHDKGRVPRQIVVSLIVLY